MSVARPLPGVASERLSAARFGPARSALVRRLGAVAMMAAVLPFAACKTQQRQIIEPMEPSVDTPTEGWGLRKLEPKDYPDMTVAWMDKTNLVRAIDKSLQFLGTASSHRLFPSTNSGDTITHDQIVATLDDVKQLIQRNITPEQFQQEVLNRYDVYTSVGYNNKGDVWFTGYFTPIYRGSRTRTAEYQYPIYSRPADLQSDPLTGEVRGTYPTRSELEKSGKLRGLELLYFRKPIEPFMIQVQGSAQVILPNNEVLYVGYAGSNGQAHKGLGTQLRDEGKIDPKHLSLPAVLSYFDQHPGELEQYVLRDDRFTFQKVYTAAERQEWPRGSLNVQVTADRSLATDKNIFPRASLAFIDVDKASPAGDLRPYKGFVLDQDAGGGIRAAGRADIFMGIGDAAGHRAGQQFAQGRLYYLFLKPENVTKGNYPDLKPVPAPAVPRPVTPGTPQGGPRPGQGTRPPAGGDEMFPGAVQRP
jgi:membrane-bound lytic murein transglycosylase A